MVFPLNIASDDAAIFSANSPGDSDDQAEDPTGPRGQKKASEIPMFLPHRSPARRRQILSTTGFPSARIPAQTPGASQIP